MASLTNQKLSCLNSVKRSEEGTRPKTVRQPAVILFEYIGDRSGSTSSIFQAQMEGLQKCVDDRREDSKKTNAKCYVSITTFDDESMTYTKKWSLDSGDYADIENIPAELDTREMLQPRGCTCLVDTAYERAVAFEKKLKEIHDSLKGTENEKVVAVFALSTDGLDNASTKHTIQDLNKVILRLRKSGAEMMFLAANQDAIATGTTFGFAPTHAMTFGATPEAANSAFKSLSQLTRDSSDGTVAPGASSGFSESMRQSSAPVVSRRGRRPGDIRMMPPRSLRMSTCVPYSPDEDSDDDEDSQVGSNVQSRNLRRVMFKSPPTLKRQNNTPPSLFRQ